ncbi:MAG: hypothetical protein Q4C44_03115 [bacterium]|nr:hypothetical protein [bacterium]
MVCIIGVSYAWFRLYLSQSENNRIASRTCFSTTLTEKTSKIDLTEAVPESDENGLRETPFTFTLKNNCTGYIRAYITIDSAYRTSTSTSYLKDNKIKVNISPTGTTLNPSSLLTDKELIELEGSRLGYSIIDVGLNSNEEKTFDLRVWMDSSTTVDEGLNKTWEGKIVVLTEAQNVGAPNGWNSAKDGSLLAAIRRDNTVSETLSIPGQEASAHTLDDVSAGTIAVSTYQSYYVTYGTGWEANGTGFNLTGTAVTTNTYANSYSELVGKYLPDYVLSESGSKTAGEMKTTTDLDIVYYVVSATSSSFTYKRLTSNKNTTEALFADTEDDYGTSYYFRGAVANNFVEYANMCWRIVRVTGNGDIKLVLYNYNGLTSTNNTPSSSTPCNVTGDDLAYARREGTSYQSAFNNVATDNTYIGLMYGAAGASSYAETHANTNPSTILTNLNKWYTNVLSKQAGFNGNQLADTIWCNDKSVVTETTFNPRSWELGTNYGYGTNKNYYNATQRFLRTTSLSPGGTGPSLICPNDNNGGKLSKFTVSDTNYGNGTLSGYAKVGLLTADEVVLAGGAYRLSNAISYLYENTYPNLDNDNNTARFWWTLSPIDFDGTNAHVWIVEGRYGNLIPGGVMNVQRTGGAIRPSVSLSSNMKISSGDGTATKPYKISAS